MRPRALLLAAALAVAACSKGDRKPLDTADTAAVLSAELMDSSRTDSVRADSAAGDSLFRRAGRCLTCHGARGEGIPGLGSDLRDAEWVNVDGSVGDIHRIIMAGIPVPKVGRAVMPAFASRLTDEQAMQIAAYVYAISHPGVVVDSTTP